MAKSLSKHKEAFQQEKPHSLGPPSVVPSLPSAEANKSREEQDAAWGFGIGLIIWMVGFFGLFIMIVIEMLIGLFR